MTSADFKKVSAPHPDGFGGARDAAILESYDREGDTVHVQAVVKTRDLLKRAGFPRTTAGNFYQVKVRVDDFNRLQLA